MKKVQNLLKTLFDRGTLMTKESRGENPFISDFEAKMLGKVEDMQKYCDSGFTMLLFVC